MGEWEFSLVSKTKTQLPEPFGYTKNADSVRLAIALARGCLEESDKQRLGGAEASGECADFGHRLHGCHLERTRPSQIAC